MYIKKGEIWITDLGINKGSEQNGIRPCLIISNFFYEDTCIIIPGSKTKRSSSFTYKNFNWLLGQIKTIDKTRLIRKISKISPSERKIIIHKWLSYIK